MFAIRERIVFATDRVMQDVNVHDLNMQDGVVIDRERLGRYRVADCLPARIAVGYLARTHHGVRVVAPFDPGLGGAARISGHLVRPVRLDGSARYIPATIQWALESERP